MVRKSAFAFLLILSFTSFFVFSSHIRASVQGRIVGVVKDSSGSPLADVRLTIISLKTSTRKFEVKTGKDGKFVQVGLWPGYYQVRAKKEGYMPYSREVRVRVDEATELELILEKADEYVARSLSVADRAFIRGNKLFAEEKYEEAAKAYLEAIDKSQSQWGYYFNLGLAYKKLGRKEEALSSFKKALELNPESYSSNTEVGELLAKEGKFSEAKEFYRKAAQLSPDDPDAFYNLGVCMMNVGDSGAAVEAFLKTVELKDDYAEAYYYLGTLFIGQNRVEEAVRNLEKFLELAPDHEKASVARQLLSYLKKIGDTIPISIFISDN
ncbi:MAG: tetratricopeptide repeat protein [Candidatus Aminicenantales bacterium]